MALRFRLRTLLVLPVLIMLGTTLWQWRETWAIDGALLAGAVAGACWGQTTLLGRAVGAGLGAAVTTLFVAPSLLHMILVDERVRISRVAIRTLALYYTLGVVALVAVAFAFAFGLALPILWTGRLGRRLWIRVAGPLARSMGTDAAARDQD